MKPNIVIVMADQLRADLRKSKGYPLDTMPFLDAYGKKWCEFSCAYTSNPTCMPARTSMLTGRMPSCHNVRTNHNAKDAVYDQDMIDVLKANGYKTALCGKNHTYLKPGDLDFWESNGHLGAEYGMHPCGDEIKFDEFLKTLDFCDSMGPSPYTVKEQLPYRNVTSFFKFIDSLDNGQPFFGWVSFAEPHNPYQVPYPYYDMFPVDALPGISTSVEDLAGKDPKFRFARWSWEKVYKDDLDARMARDRSNYLGMMRLIDDQFKRLVEGLIERNLEQNTLVIFLSDHGDFVGEYGLIRKGPALSEPLVRIPFVIGGCGVQCKGEDSVHFVNIVDILPTVCDLIGIKVPFGVQGRSLLPLLSSQNCFPEKDFEIGYSESGFGGLYWDRLDDLDPVREGATVSYKTFDCLNTWSQSGQVRMVRKGDYKLVVDMLGAAYLYNLKNDPLERRNLVSDENYKDVLSDLAVELASQMMRYCDPIPSPCSRYRVKRHPKGFWFDMDFHVMKDPGVEYHPVEVKGN